MSADGLVVKTPLSRPTSTALRARIIFRNRVRRLKVAEGVLAWRPPEPLLLRALQALRTGYRQIHFRTCFF